MSLKKSSKGVNKNSKDEYNEKSSINNESNENSSINNESKKNQKIIDQGKIRTITKVIITIMEMRTMKIGKKQIKNQKETI